MRFLNQGGSEKPDLWHAWENWKYILNFSQKYEGEMREDWRVILKRAVEMIIRVSQKEGNFLSR
jgi:hypothetical protein